MAAPESNPRVEFRPLDPHDQEKLWHWLHLALWDPPPAGLRPREVLQAPGVRIYAEHWGLPSDIGVVARVQGVDAGACWMRLLPEGVGLGSVDAQTPQLGIALEPAFRHRGYGRPLMREALKRAGEAGYRQVSLTVHPQNPARALYERCGFRDAGRRNDYHLMLASTARPCTGTPGTLDEQAVGFACGASSAESRWEASMDIATAVIEDAHAIAAVHLRSWQAAYADFLDPAWLSALSIEARTARWKEAIAGNESRIAVRRRGGSVSAFVSFGPCRDEGAPASRGEIWALYAAPEAWGQGDGKALVRFALDALHASGFTDVSLWVLSANRRGIRFYEALGFERVPGSETRFELGGREVEEVAYRRRCDGHEPAAPAAHEARSARG